MTGGNSMARIRIGNPTGIVELRYTVVDVDRHGNVRVYVRRHGRKIRLRHLYDTAAFFEEYRVALETTETGKPVEKAFAPAKRGSFKWLSEGYYKSAEFKRLHPRTQRVRRNILDDFNAIHGDKPFNRMEPRHVRSWRDGKSGKPEAANALVKALRQVFVWGCQAGDCDRNPAAEVPYIRSLSPGFHSWSAEEVERFEQTHPIGTSARLALALLLYTGQRRSDIVRLGRQHVRDGWLVFTQAKNEHRNPIHIKIPILPCLQQIIDATPSGNMNFLVTQFGKPFTANGFGNRFRKWCDEAGLQNCSAHGLRKAAATRLAEQGATEHEIMAVTGHQSSKEVMRYTRAARRELLANSAMQKLAAGQNMNESVPLSEVIASSGTKRSRK